MKFDTNLESSASGEFIGNLINVSNVSSVTPIFKPLLFWTLFVTWLPPGSVGKKIKRKCSPLRVFFSRAVKEKKKKIFLSEFNLLPQIATP